MSVAVPHRSSPGTGSDSTGVVWEGEAVSVIFGSQVSLRVHYCKRDEVLHNTTVTKQWMTKWPYIANAVFQIVDNVMVTKVTLVGFSGGSNRPFPGYCPGLNDVECVATQTKDVSYIFVIHCISNHTIQIGNHTILSRMFFGHLDIFLFRTA